MLDSIQIIADYPLWFIVFCLLCGAVYAFVLYFRSKLEISKKLLYLLSALRFLTISFIAFLLLSPYVKSLTTKVEKPIVVFAQDNSESIIINKDSTYYKSEYPKEVNDFLAKLGKKFTVRKYQFGSRVEDKISFNYKDNETNINDLLETINSKFVNRNVGALVLATDGIYNIGINPLYSNVNFNFPVYTLALGDTMPPRDLKITQVLHNDIAFLNNQFPLQITVDANDCKNENTHLVIEHNGKEVYNQPVSLSKKDFHQNFKVLLKAQQAGLQKYMVKLTHLKKEISYENNRFEVYINVLNSKQKILILANSPNPDVAAVRQALESSENYKVEAYTFADFKKSIKPYDLIILYDLPSKNQPLSNSKLKQIFTSNKPLWLFLGAQNDVSEFDKLATGLNYQGFGTKNNEVFGDLNKNFSIFTIPKENYNIYDAYPPANSLFGDYRLSSGAKVLMYQKIGSVRTQNPLWFFNVIAGRKVSVFCGTGLWRWRIYNFKNENNTDAFDYLIKKTVQYLALKTNQSRFKINYKKKYEANEPIKIEGQFYNKAYQPENKPDLEINIFNSKGKKYNFAFNKPGKGYFLNAGTLPKGHYTFQASLKGGNKVFSKKGDFSIVPVQKEAIQLTANHNLLFNLSKKYGGKMFYPKQLKELLKALMNRKDIASVASQQTNLKSIINIKWLFFLILFLLTGEWLLRRYFGSY